MTPDPRPASLDNDAEGCGCGCASCLGIIASAWLIIWIVLASMGLIVRLGAWAFAWLGGR